jgi:hypothetical protein
MASYINNIAQNAQIAEVLPFTPDWQFLSSAQQTLSDMQTKAFESFADKYSTYLKQDLTRQDTLAFREKFLKEADNKIKMVSGTDLTDPRNLQNAGSIFNELTNNKLYIADIMQTKAIKKGLETAQAFATAPDAAARALYNPYSQKLLQYAQRDFMNASSDEAVRMQTPTYVPGVDFRTLSKKVLDDYGMNVEYDEQSGTYLYTYTNGQVVEPAMQSAITRELSKDPAVMAYADTRVEAEFRDASENLIATGLSRQEAQLQVANTYLNAIATQSFTEEQLGNIRSYIDANTAVKEHEKKMAEKPYTPGSAEDIDYRNLKTKVQKLEMAKQDAEAYLNLTGSSSPEATVERAKLVMRNSELQQEFTSQAGFFALKNSKFKINADDLAKAAGTGKGSDKSLNPDYADYTDIGAPGASVKEERNWAVSDGNAIVDFSREITELKRDALKVAALMDVPEITSLVKDLDIDALSREQVVEFYKKVDNAFNSSESAKSSDLALTYLGDKDKINDAFASYKGYLDQKRNNNLVIKQELEKEGDQSIKYLFDSNGRIRTKEEYYTAAGIREVDTIDPFGGKSFLESADERGVAFGSGVAVIKNKKQTSNKPSDFGAYEKALRRFTEKYNSTIRKAGSPITSISAQIEGLQGEGYNYPRVSYLYDQKSPKSAARELSENMYQNLANSSAYNISIGDNTGVEGAQSQLAESLIKGALRKLLTEQMSSDTENRIQYQISFQDAALGEANKSAYTIKFTDPSKIKEFVLTSGLDEAGQAEFQRMVIEGFTVVMEDKNMVNRPMALSKKETALTTAFKANGNTLNENIPGYGYFKVAQKSDSPNTVIVSLSQNGNVYTLEYPIGVMDKVYRDWRNQGYQQKKQQRLNAQQ